MAYRAVWWVVATLWVLGTTAGCVGSSSVQCEGGYTCPSGTLCGTTGQQCLHPQQLESCVGQEDYAPCTYPGVSGGNCIAGVCLSGGCGNNHLDPGEVCDDGNTAPRDGCSTDCYSDETCGNSKIDVAVGETCDDGNTVDADGCQGTASCRAAATASSTWPSNATMATAIRATAVPRTAARMRPVRMA